MEPLPEESFGDEAADRSPDGCPDEADAGLCGDGIGRLDWCNCGLREPDGPTRE